MTFRPKISLNGKRLTEDQATKEIHDLLYGTGKRPYPLSPTEVARLLGVSRRTVYNYIKRIAIQKKESGRLDLPKDIDTQFRIFNEHHKITANPLITEWMDDLLTRKQGKPLKSWKEKLLSVEAVCNTCRVNPEDLIVSKHKTEKIMRSFAKLYLDGSIVQPPQGAKSQGMGTSIYKRVKGVRDLCAFYDITWRKGVTGIMSQKVPGHGKYSDIRLSDKELESADRFIKERWGLDSDIYRWFWVRLIPDVSETCNTKS